MGGRAKLKISTEKVFTCVKVKDIYASMLNCHSVDKLLDRVIRGLIQLVKLPIGRLQSTQNDSMPAA